MIYHVSYKAGLRTLVPHVSTHGKAWVYAIENMVTALLFGAKKDDFDFIISTDGEDRPVVYECYPDAFRKIFCGTGCSVYELEEEGFLRNMTSWSPELVSESEVTVKNEIVIEDLYDRLMEEEASGNLLVYRYEFNEEYRKRIASHIVDRLIRFNVDLDHCMEQDDRFAVHYRGIVEGLAGIMDGHLLK